MLEKFPGITHLFKVEHMHVFNRVDIFKLRIILPVKCAFSIFPSLNTVKTFLITAGLSSVSFFLSLVYRKKEGILFCINFIPYRSFA